MVYYDYYSSYDGNPVLEYIASTEEIAKTYIKLKYPDYIKEKKGNGVTDGYQYVYYTEQLVDEEF
jgi:hypothetical protein